VLDGQRAGVDTENLSGLLLNLRPVGSAVHHRQRLMRAEAEHDVHIVKDDGVAHLRSLLIRSIRSSMIATTTMTKPLSKPSAVLT
jgi:hypothetical protein